MADWLRAGVTLPRWTKVLIAVPRAATFVYRFAVLLVSTAILEANRDRGLQRPGERS